MLGSVDREGAPPTADVEESLCFRELEFATYEVGLALLCLIEWLLWIEERPGRVDHSGVEKLPEEGIACVVMGGDRRPVATLGVQTSSSSLAGSGYPAGSLRAAFSGDEAAVDIDVVIDVSLARGQITERQKEARRAPAWSRTMVARASSDPHTSPFQTRMATAGSPTTAVSCW